MSSIDHSAHVAARQEPLTTAEKTEENKTVNWQFVCVCVTSVSRFSCFFLFFFLVSVSLSLCIRFAFDNIVSVFGRILEIRKAIIYLKVEQFKMDFFFVPRFGFG